MGEIPRDDLDELSALWLRQWPAPPGDVPMRRAYPDRWVRFHALPESKQYPEDEGEYGVVLGRHQALLAELGELSPSDDGVLYVLVNEWSEQAEPVGRMAALQKALPNAQYCDSWLDERYRDGVHSHQYVSRCARSSPEISALLRLVADGLDVEVTLIPSNVGWLYSPYPGGVDIFAPSADARDALRTAHPTWLSTDRSGM
ncbi:hypothetical protein [Streptomyces sp. NPDC058394]|uniref:DUF3885 domain-containing protein n=1 Tax=unclassified Streptomyces TaxID=2593676 RepID=UPI003653AD70